MTNDSANQKYNPFERAFNEDAQPNWRDITDDDRERAISEMQRVCDDAKDEIFGE